MSLLWTKEMTMANDKERLDALELHVKRLEEKVKSLQEYAEAVENRSERAAEIFAAKERQLRGSIDDAENEHRADIMDLIRSGRRSSQE